MTDFWDWAVKVYGGEGVAEACLRLQDEDGQNVPLLLWAIWLACEGWSVSESQARKAADLARNWSSELIAPLRLLRRRLKTELSTGDEALRLPLREKIKAIELEAERALMLQLAGLNDLMKIDLNQSVNRQAFNNLRVMSQAWDHVVPESALLRLIEALSDGRFLQYNL
jgi:uncharacterized protein (TIGR02444 family)